MTQIGQTIDSTQTSSYLEPEEMVEAVAEEVRQSLDTFLEKPSSHTYVAVKEAMRKYTWLVTGE